MDMTAPVTQRRKGSDGPDTFVLSFVMPSGYSLDSLPIPLLLTAGGLMWILAALLFATIREQPGATEGGGNAISVAIKQLRLIVDDAPFRRFVLARTLLLSIALAPPFYETADGEVDEARGVARPNAPDTNKTGVLSR